MPAEDNEEGQSGPPEESESEAPDTTDIYHTLGDMERIVYGGGGITPDVIVEVPDFPLIVQDLLRQSAFFEFAVKYTAVHSDLEPGFEIDDEMVSEFREFLEEKEHDFEEADFADNLSDIKNEIAQYIASDLWGTQGWYESALVEDAQVLKAIELLELADATDDLLVLAVTD
jgi:carboxyl-terminal processing protease